MKVLDLSHHKEIAKEFKTTEYETGFEVKRFPINKNSTIIVGANNSRKSRFLRYVLKEKIYLTIDRKIYYFSAILNKF